MDDSAVSPKSAVLTESADTDTPTNLQNPPKRNRARSERKFPALTFQQAIELADSIQRVAAGKRVRRSTLFETLNKSPDSSTTRSLITSSGQYGLTKGAYNADFLELTPKGHIATSDDATAIDKLSSRFSLAITNIKPFNELYLKFKDAKLPARDILADNLEAAGIANENKEECVDTFTVNCKFLTILRTIAGSERLISIEQALDTLPDKKEAASSSQLVEASISTQLTAVSQDGKNRDYSDFTSICFYVTPIGNDSSEQRSHADFMMEYIVKPAVSEFNMTVVRADQIGQPGMIGKQVVEHILKCKLVIADLSFHNPNVFYELCLRHVTRLPTVQLKRASDGLPFDLNQSRTISIETADVYRIYPKLQTYVSEVASQIRGALQNIESADNPISLYYPKARLILDETS